MPKTAKKPVKRPPTAVKPIVKVNVKFNATTAEERDEALEEAGYKCVTMLYTKDEKSKLAYENALANAKKKYESLEIVEDGYTKEIWVKLK